MERAKELFLMYSGSHFHMDRSGDGGEYDSYHISKETEEMWASEYISHFLESELTGKEALRAYSAALDLLQGYGRAGDWDRLLYYPLRAAHLDDVTILFMLSESFRAAERAAEKHRFSREEADANLRELEGYIQLVSDRAEKGALTRAADYTMMEFSDPAYVVDYLDELRGKWAQLPC